MFYSQASNITSQMYLNDQTMLFQVTAAGTALSINCRTKQKTDL